jgi:hypothetical protein
MKIDDSNKRYSMIIAGILIVSVASVFLAISLGYGGFKENPNNPFSMEIYANSGKKTWNDGSPGNNKSVSVAQECEIIDLDTAQGEIKPNTDYTNIPTTLPLCIDDSVVKDWWIAYLVCGDYDVRKISCRYYGKIELRNDKDGLLGTIYMEGVEVTDLPCCWKLVNFTNFDVDPVNGFEIPSNYKPIVDPACNLYMHKDYDHSKGLGKEVDLLIKTWWKGCDQDIQKFRLILAHKNLFLESPTPEIKISSPVECNKHLIYF